MTRPYNDSWGLWTSRQGMVKSTMTIERPKSSLKDYTFESRAVDKLMEVIADEIIVWIEESIESPEFDTEEWDAAETMMWEIIRERLNKNAEV